MKKKMLFLAHRFPYPPNKGDKIRSLNEVRFFSEEFEIDLVTFVDSKNDLQYSGQLSKFCSNLFIFRIHKIPAFFKAFLFFLVGKSLSEGYYYNGKCKKQIYKLINTRDYSYIFCYSSQVAQFVLSNQNVPKIMDFVDVDSDKWLQYSGMKSFPANLIYKIESYRLRQYENNISNTFSMSVFATENERELFHSDGLSNIFVMSNGVDAEYFIPVDVEKEEALVFVGAMDYYPNVDAVTWFVENVFINLIEHLPDIKFFIVGSNPSNSVINLSKISKNIIVTGFVNDVRPYLSKAKLAVMPLRIARGIQNKILEAMAMELPVIINENLFNSFDNLKINDVFIYKNASDLKNIILETISNTELLSKMGIKLRQYVQNYYDWPKNLKRLSSSIKNIQFY